MVFVSSSDLSSSGQRGEFSRSAKAASITTARHMTGHVEKPSYSCMKDPRRGGIERALLAAEGGPEVDQGIARSFSTLRQPWP